MNSGEDHDIVWPLRRLSFGTSNLPLHRTTRGIAPQANTGNDSSRRGHSL